MCPSPINSPERFAQLVQAFFCDYLIQQRDVSPRTVSTYRDTFRLLLSFLPQACGKRPEQLTFADLTAAQVLAFLRHLEEQRGNSVRTRNLRLAALRSFFRYAGACAGPELLAQTQRILAIPLKRFARPLLGFLSEQEMQALLQAMDHSWSGRRDHLLFLLMYNTGARVSEILSVRVQDVQPEDYRAVQLRGKGRKERRVPLWKQTAQHIRAWLKRTGLKAEQPLLPNRFGGPMTRTAVQQRLRLHVQAAQATCPSLRHRRISPHTLRHATAMHLLQAGVAAPVIALWLGHEDPATTHQYIEADLLMKEKALRRLQPPKTKRARFKPRASLLEFLDNL
jgi:integrase/recombinase XerD